MLLLDHRTKSWFKPSDCAADCVNLAGQLLAQDRYALGLAQADVGAHGQRQGERRFEAAQLAVAERDRSRMDADADFILLRDGRFHFPKLERLRRPIACL